MLRSAAVQVSMLTLREELLAAGAGGILSCSALACYGVLLPFIFCLW